MKKIILITKKKDKLFAPIMETFLDGPYNKGATAREQADKFVTQSLQPGKVVVKAEIQSLWKIKR